MSSPDLDELNKIDQSQDAIASRADAIGIDREVYERFESSYTISTESISSNEARWGYAGSIGGVIQYISIGAMLIAMGLVMVLLFISFRQSLASFRQPLTTALISITGLVMILMVISSIITYIPRYLNSADGVSNEAIFRFRIDQAIVTYSNGDIDKSWNCLQQLRKINNNSHTRRGVSSGFRLIDDYCSRVGEIDTDTGEAKLSDKNGFRETFPMLSRRLIHARVTTYDELDHFIYDIEVTDSDDTEDTDDINPSKFQQFLSDMGRILSPILRNKIVGGVIVTGLVVIVADQILNLDGGVAATAAGIALTIFYAVT